VIDPAAAPYDTTKAFEHTARRSNDVKTLERLKRGRVVIDRNKKLIAECDVVLANLLHSKSASIGSVGEIFWAYAFGKPIIIVREDHGNVHDHAMLNAMATVIVDTLQEGCAAVRDLIGAPLISSSHHVSSSASADAS
jgi:nucleoside 2-deoxyribosyltransferase